MENSSGHNTYIINKQQTDLQDQSGLSKKQKPLNNTNII